MCSIIHEPLVCQNGELGSLMRPIANLPLFLAELNVASSQNRIVTVVIFNKFVTVNALFADLSISSVSLLVNWILAGYVKTLATPQSVTTNRTSSLLLRAGAGCRLVPFLPPCVVCPSTCTKTYHG